MYTPPQHDTDEPEHVARFLADGIGATWRAFDKGRALADEFFEDDHRAFDPHLWAHIVRYEAVLSLASESGPRDWELHPYHHSGIEFRKEPFCVRVYKAAGDDPQNPGHSRARRHFFQQLGMLNLFSTQEPQNLILMWRVREGDLELGLCKPKGVWRFKGVPKLEWQQMVTFDPLAGLSFPTADDEDVQVALRLDEADLREQEDG